jgi:hypothetical protein
VCARAGRFSESVKAIFLPDHGDASGLTVA